MYIKFFRPCKLEKVYYYNYNERNCFNFNEELWSPTCISPNNLIKYLGGGGRRGGNYTVFRPYSGVTRIWSIICNFYRMPISTINI